MAVKIHISRVQERFAFALIFPIVIVCVENFNNLYLRQQSATFPVKNHRPPGLIVKCSLSHGVAYCDLNLVPAGLKNMLGSCMPKVQIGWKSKGFNFTLRSAFLLSLFLSLSISGQCIYSSAIKTNKRSNYFVGHAVPVITT